MAKVFKRGSNWYFRFTDANGRRVMRKGCADKRATEGLLAEMEAEVRRVKLGLSSPRDEALRRFGRVPIGDHLTAWHAALLSSGVTHKHAHEYYRQAAWLIDRGGVYHLCDLEPDRIRSALDRLRKTRSLRTVFHYATAVKSFAAWLRSEGRTREDQLAALAKPANPEGDRRHRRRALTPAEFDRLIAATESQDRPRCKLSGPDRATLYRVAVGTGLRASELLSLTPESFALDSDPPTVTVAPGYSKRRKRDVQPLSPALAALLKPWLAARPPGRPLWRLDLTHAAETLRGDLEAAGIDYSDAAGRVVDFHALRVTYVSLLVRAGTPLAVVQVLARHSTPVLTANTYTDLGVCDPAGAVASLPVGATDRQLRQSIQQEAS